MVEYVRGSQIDKWHWCENCTQYPMYAYQKTSQQPPNLCEQCKSRENSGNCQCEGTSKKEEPRLKRDIPVFCKPNLGNQP